MITCPVCSKPLTEIASGLIRVHGPKPNRCAGSGMHPDAAQHATETRSGAPAASGEPEQRPRTGTFADWTPKDPEIAAKKAEMDKAMQVALDNARNLTPVTVTDPEAELEHLNGSAQAQVANDYEGRIEQATPGQLQATPGIGVERTPEFDPFCPRCDTDMHRCPGCGDAMDHAHEVCDGCQAEHATPAPTVPAQPAEPNAPAVPAFLGRQRMESLGVDMVLGLRECAEAALELLRRTTKLSCDIESFGLGKDARRLKAVIFSDVPEGTVALILDPRDERQAKLIRWIMGQATELVFHNSAFDVPNLAVNSLFEVEWCAKVTDTLLYARQAEPDNRVSKSLGDCANRYLGLAYDKNGMANSAKATGIKSTQEMYHKFDLDRPVYVRGAATDATVTARLLPRVRKAALSRFVTGHPFTDWGVAGQEALDLMQREQKLNRMSLRRTVKGLVADLDHLDRFNAHYGNDIARWEAELTAAGIRPTVAPDLLAKLDELGVIPEGYPRTEKTGALSGAKDNLEKIAHPLAAMFREHKEATHILKDYLEKVRDLAVPGPDGLYRLHPVINYLGATTGRQSVGSPPLQQFPGVDPDSLKDPDYRGMAISARGIINADPGDSLTSIDWSQIEPVVIANVAGQTDMLEGYESGREDFYDTLARVTRLPRKANKTQLLGTLYGQGFDLTRAKLGVSEERAREIKNAVFAPMPRVLELTYTLRDIAREYEMIPTISGRIIPVPSGWYKKPGAEKSEYSVQTHKGVNYHVQGSAYDVLAEALLRCEESGYGDAIYLGMHDEIVCSTSAAEDVRRIMSQPPERLCIHSGRTPVLRTDMKHLGQRWEVA